MGHQKCIGNRQFRGVYPFFIQKMDRLHTMRRQCGISQPPRTYFAFNHKPIYHHPTSTKPYDDNLSNTAYPPPPFFNQTTARQQLSIIAGNKGATGPFAPLVVAVRNVMGTKEFNQFRGKAISLHSQIIKEFGSTIGADIRQVQGLIRLAKNNGEKVGFLA